MVLQNKSRGQRRDPKILCRHLLFTFRLMFSQGFMRSEAPPKGSLCRLPHPCSDFWGAPRDGIPSPAPPSYLAYVGALKALARSHDKRVTVVFSLRINSALQAAVNSSTLLVSVSRKLLKRHGCKFGPSPEVSQTTNQF